MEMGISGTETVHKDVHRRCYRGSAFTSHRVPRENMSETIKTRLFIMLVLSILP